MFTPTVLFTGGGTLGPVTPLLSAARLLRERRTDVRIVWVGTPDGPERELVERDGHEFFALKAPKFDRTRVWTLPCLLPRFVLSVFRANTILNEIQPDVIVSAGAYVSVPVAYAARTKSLPVILEQLDIVPGIANKLMAPLAEKIFVTWEENKKSFSQKKVEVVGGSVRKSMLRGEARLAVERFGLRPHTPTVLIIGGGTGAVTLNELFAVIGPELVKRANVIHLTGRGKMIPALQKFGAGYYATEFLGEGLADAYAAADLVVARAGMGTIMEVAALKKATLLIPLPGTHQEANARAVASRAGAMVLPPGTTPQNVLQTLFKIVGDEAFRARLSEGVGKCFPFLADERMVEEIERQFMKEAPSHDLGKTG
jgi:UDP-N-acetylglucosamine--N-acetylmuramyl-(pentapeptide) pyrophosphoryl-undecaprenol N-acetylglucosamine transferase